MIAISKINDLVVEIFKELFDNKVVKVWRIGREGNREIPAT